MDNKKSKNKKFCHRFTHKACFFFRLTIYAILTVFLWATFNVTISYNTPISNTKSTTNVHITVENKLHCPSHGKSNKKTHKRHRSKTSTSSHEITCETSGVEPPVRITTNESSEKYEKITTFIKLLIKYLYEIKLFSIPFFLFYVFIYTLIFAVIFESTLRNWVIKKIGLRAAFLFALGFAGITLAF